MQNRDAGAVLSPVSKAGLSLRWHLVLLVAGALLPIVIFSILVVEELSEQARATSERRLLMAARNMASAIDREISNTTRGLQTLAISDQIERDDIKAFYVEAKRALRVQPTWQAVSLLAPNGRKIFNTERPFGAPLPPVSEPISLQRVVETREPAVGYLVRSNLTGQWAFPVRVPIMHAGTVKYVLTAVITPETLAGVVESQQPAEGEWVRTIIDQRGIIVARTREPERFVGQPATTGFMRVSENKREAVYRNTSVDGTVVYGAFSRTDAGWATPVAVPIDVIDKPSRESLWTVIIAGIAVLLLSGIAALVLSRRISASIESAAAAANVLAKGERPHVVSSSIEEVAMLGRALKTSADLLLHREQERNEHLARAEAARSDAEAANRLKDEFLSTVSHELRTPLQAILGWVKLLSAGKLDKTKTQNALAIIERNAKTQTHLVNDLLDMSRIITGKLHLEKKPVNLATVVASAVEAVQLAAEAKDVTLRQQWSADVFPVIGDQDRLHQVVWNLLWNALKFTPSKGQIDIELHSIDTRVELVVSDSGVGIKPEFLPYVFDRFRQANGSASRQFGGLGVGLAIVRQLVESHGGTVRAESAGEGKGATFIVSLPLAREGMAAEEVDKAGAHNASILYENTEALRGVRVLVVDDDVDVRDLVGILLTQHGAIVRSCASAAEAFREVTAASPDVILCDIGMAQEDGYDFLRKVRQHDAETGTGRKIPAAAITAYARIEDRVRALAAGYQAHIPKPVDPAELIAVVASLIVNHAPKAGRVDIGTAR